MRKVTLMAMILLAIGPLACSSSTNPTPAPVAAPPKAEQPAAPAVTALGGDKTVASVVTKDPKAPGLLVRDVHVPDGVVVDASKTAIDRAGEVKGDVRVAPRELKDVLHCPPEALDHCEDKPDGSIVVHDKPAKGK